jgi:predicted Zn finger-like uncharacterized protein
MPHATRCPACRTCFQVTSEQLRVSDGWVRCGQCDEIFDARLQLRDLAALRAARSSPGPHDTVRMADVATGAEASSGSSGLLHIHSGQPLEAVDAEPMRYTPPGIDAVPHPSAYRPPSPQPPPPSPESPPPPAFLPPAASSVYAQDAQRDPQSEGTEPKSAAAWVPLDSDIPSALLLHTADSDVPQDQLYDPAFAAPALPPAGSADAAVDEDPELQRLSFMREARRRAFWSRPLMRAVVAFAGMALLAALAVQVAHHERDRIAAHFPGARPALASMCGLLGCAIAPLRQIEAVTLDNARFGQVAPGRYQLALGMHNSAATGIATPSAELTLTDVQGRTVFRRVLRPQELGAPAVLPAGGDWNGVLVLSVPDEAQAAAISDYGLLLFYP